jgi:hypothetical protein
VIKERNVGFSLFCTFPVFTQKTGKRLKVECFPVSLPQHQKVIFSLSHKKPFCGLRKNVRVIKKCFVAKLCLSHESNYVEIML